MNARRFHLLVTVLSQAVYAFVILVIATGCAKVDETQPTNVTQGTTSTESSPLFKDAKETPGIGLKEKIIPPSLEGAVAGGSRQRWDCIAFHTGWQDNPGAEIYVVNLNRSGLTRLTYNNSADYSPAFSPDGTKITFISWRDGDGAVYIMNSDGSDQRRLSAPNPHPLEYEDVWSRFTPDGKRIAAMRDYNRLYRTVFFPVNGGSEELFTVGDCDGLVGDAGGAYCVEFSPDGRMVAFSLDIPEDGLDQELWTANADGSGAHLLTKDCDLNYSFSPDSKQIVHSVYLENGQHIFISNSDGSKHRQLTGGIGNDHSPKFSPDGKRIIYVSRVNDDAPCFRSDTSVICVMDINGNGCHSLTNTDLFADSPAFTPDGTKIVFLAETKVDDVVKSFVYVMNSDGTQLHRILEEGSGFFLGPSLVISRLVDSYGNWHDVAK